jgi:predicted amidohydrolase
MATITAYRAVCMQVKCRAVSMIKEKAEARALMQESLERLRHQTLAALAFLGDDVKLAVFPEYFLTGFPLGDPLPVWADKVCLEMNGPEYEALGKLAQDGKIYLAGNAYEVDAHFPGLYFQTSFLIDPAGQVILRYRRLNSMFSPTPHDVWDKYLDVYGLDGVFPVAKTPLGNFAAIASEEILFPEIARCHAMRGAEIFLHSSSQANETAKAAKEVCTIARAVENAAYVVSVNSGGYQGTPVLESSADGGSKIVDYQGIVLTKTGWGESSAAVAELQLAALRRFRQRPGMDNLLARQRFEAYAESYARHQHYPPNNLTEGASDRSHFLNTQKATIARLVKCGVLSE